MSNVSVKVTEKELGKYKKIAFEKEAINQTIDELIEKRAKLEQKLFAWWLDTHKKYGLDENRHLTIDFCTGEIKGESE